MKANEVPEKIYLNPDAVPHNQSGKFLFIHNSDIDESKCTIEYIHTDTFIEKAWDWIEDNMLSSNQQDKSHLYFEQFKKYMRKD